MTGTRLTDEQRLDWLRLIRSENIGPRTFRALVNQFGGAAAALEALPGLARRRGRAVLKVATRADAEREMERAARRGVRFAALGEPEYPRTLQAIETAPPLLAVRGSVDALRRPTVAIVGSRNASAAGLTFTERLARELGSAGFVVVSGLARGIDSRAHKAALATAAVTRYSSLSALAASVATPVALWLMGERQMAELFILLALLLWWKHSQNITRLLAGTEGRIGQKG